MANKNNYSTNYSTDFNDTYIPKTIINHTDNEFFDEALAVKQQVITIRRVGVIDKSERWKIGCDGKVIMTVEASKLNKKEVAFVRTPEGCSFIISQIKNGIKSFNKLKAELKKKIK